jgi:hypothetical protein
MAYPFNPTFEESALLAEIRRRESGGNYSVTISTATCLKLTGRTDCTASGAYQFTNATWRDATQATGVGTEYATAAQAPQWIQDANALWLLRTRGTAPWASFSRSPLPAGNGGPMVDVSGDAAATPTASILDQIGASLTEATGVDVTPTEAGVAIALVVAAAIYVSV